MPTNSTSRIIIKDSRFLIKLLHHRRFFIVLGRVILVLALLAILYYQLFERKEVTLGELYDLFGHQLSMQRLPILIGVMLLMPINWLIETQKWVVLLQPIQQLRVFQALKVVLMGLTGSLFTPNRIGEYGGRLLLLDPKKRYQAVYATLLGACSQWIVLILLGWWALMLAFAQEWLPLSQIGLWVLLGIGLLSSIALLTAYFHLKRFLNWAITWKWATKWTAPIQETPFDYYEHRLLWKALAYALLRSLTYSIQYVGLLYFFGYESSLLLMLAGVLIVFLLQTGIPLPPSTGLLARGNIALFIFGSLEASALNSSILAATFSLWLLNVILPAVWGAWFVVRMGISSTEEEQAEDTPAVSIPS
ncbi:MAG: hypothetical protein ACRBFS_00685 [Aureispira sp.]